MELIRDLGRGPMLRIIKSSLLAALLVSVYAVTLFAGSVENSFDQGLSADAGREMLSISDSLYEPEAYAEAAGSTREVASAMRFYNELTNLSSGNFLSVFDQNLSIENFDGDDALRAPLGDSGDVTQPYAHPEKGTSFQDVRSVQMSRSAWEFYNLKVDSGSAFAWEDVNFENPTIPLILGSAFQETYDLGDIIVADFYGRVMKLEVVGFTRSSSHIYYKGNINHSLERAAILPYPEKLQPNQASEENARFYSILAFAIIAGDIAIEPEASTSTVSAEIGRSSQRSDFHSYALVGVPEYLTQYTLVRDLISDNRFLVTCLILMILAVTSALLMWTNQRTAHARGPWISSLWILGEPRREIVRTILRANLIYLALSLLLLHFGVSQIPARDARALFTVAASLIVIAAFDILHELWLARRAIDATPESGLNL